MKFTVNMLLTCIRYCAPGPAAIRIVCKYSHVLFSYDSLRDMP